MNSHEILSQYFGHESFRKNQEELIENILKGHDVLGIMPTGGGKSICFQVPSLMFEGITLVISPLISLMKDQVNSLTQSGVSAAFINSSLTERQIVRALERAGNGAYKIIYTSPERLLNENFLYFARNAKISMVTIDEAHCISQWGQDFRPSYTSIPDFLFELKERPVVSAFTATATPLVQNDIIAQLSLETPKVFISGFDRPNLFYSVEKPSDKFQALLNFLEEKRHLSGIIYCSTRNAVEDVWHKLKQNGHSAACYHAGLVDSTRNTGQDDFLYDRVKIIVATNAFGMGIDKSNVSFVVHYNMPKDIESYYQEAGRAGRDGTLADCLLLYGKSDLRTNMFFIDKVNETEHLDLVTESLLKERQLKKLKEMDMYCHTAECLREYLLKYFGENPTEKCSGCANCETDYNEEDITEEAKKIISCVVRMKERFGVKMVIDVLRGMKNSKLTQLGLNKLSTYGISTKTAAKLDEIINYLILNDFLVRTVDKFPVLKLGSLAKSALQEDSVIVMRSKTKTRYSQPTESLVQTNPLNPKLLSLLKELRLSIANEQKLPAFVIFHDSTLVDMCIKMPTDIEAFKEVSGVGKHKAERYGEVFIGKIKDFIDNPENTPQTPADVKEINLTSMEATDTLLNISGVADIINCVLIEKGMKKLTGQKINEWLISKGYLQIETDSKNTKIPTQEGEELGITVENRTIRGSDVKINLYNKEAQEFILGSVSELINF